MVAALISAAFNGEYNPAASSLNHIILHTKISAAGCGGTRSKRGKQLENQTTWMTSESAGGSETSEYKNGSASSLEIMSTGGLVGATF